jgi:hypothetical protein
VARASAAGPAPNLSQLMNTAPVRDTVPDVSSSASEPVTTVFGLFVFGFAVCLLVSFRNKVSTI